MNSNKCFPAYKKSALVEASALDSLELDVTEVETARADVEPTALVFCGERSFITAAPLTVPTNKPRRKEPLALCDICEGWILKVIEVSVCVSE